MGDFVQIGVKYLSGRYDFLQGLEGQLHIDFGSQILTFELAESHARTKPIRINFRDLTHFESEIHGTIRKRLRISLGYNARKPGAPDLFQVKDSWVKVEEINSIRDRIYQFQNVSDKSIDSKVPFLSSIGEFTASLERLSKSVIQGVAKVGSDLAKTGETVIRPPPPKPPEMETKFKEIYLPEVALSVYDSSWEVGPYRRKGDPLVFIHGIGLGAWVWNHQLSRFSRKRRCIAYDLRGHGSSEQPKDGYSVTHHSQDLSELLDILKVPSPRIFVAHSIGGMICLQHILNNFETVSAMVLIATWAQFPPDIRKAAKFLPPVATWGPLKGKARKMAPQALLANPESYLAQMIVPRIEKTPDRVLSASVKEIIRKCNFADRLEELDRPVLVVRGAEDNLSKEEDAKVLVKGLPVAQYVEIPRTGHFPQLERPLTTYRTISKFLKEL